MTTFSSKIASAALVVAFAATTSSCHIYKKFDMPDQSAIGQELIQAAQLEQDSTALGNLPWQEVFTDPVLADLISQALENNKDLENARLNIEVAHANMLGARLSYLPSLALAPSISSSTSIGGSKPNWSYQIPLSASWEIDIFGKI
ncbi:MAG: TolC family protein, partial [Muribaculaceae bacterium]|nr:TolC family protein [Muribaculaceae bacterium]